MTTIKRTNLPWTTVTYPNGSWVDYSFSPANADLTGDLFVSVSYFVIALGFMILIHSFIINKFSWSIVRICTDAACITTIGQMFCLLECAVTCSTIESVVFVNLLANGFFSAVVQACDNYITFARYAVVVDWQISKRRYILTTLYVILNLYGCWWPFFTFAPFIASMNTPYAKDMYTNFQIYWNFPTYILYNAYHSYLLFIEITAMRNQKIQGLDTTRLEVMALKSIFHDMISIIAVACYCFLYPLGAALQDILIMLALHFIFNWKYPTRLMERYLQSTKVGDGGSIIFPDQDEDSTTDRIGKKIKAHDATTSQ